MDTLGFWIAIVSVVLVLMAAFPPTKALLEWAVGNNRIFTIPLHLLHVIVEAHKVVIRNFGPRVTVLPYLDKGGTEKK